MAPNEMEHRRRTGRPFDKSSSPVTPACFPECERVATGEQLQRLLERGYEFAASQLEGIDEAALELADLAGDDRRTIEQAFRVVAARVRREPSHANKQVASLIRRAIELGMWRWEWEDTKPVP
jgi:hypothetical protein